MQILSYIFSIGAFIFCAYVAYQVFVRYLKIKDLPEVEISERERKDYLEVLRKYSLITTGATILNIFGFVFSFLEFRLVVAVITVVICCNVFSDLLDEIADFDTTKKDSDILFDYLKAAKADSKEKAKNNKIKKIDSLETMDVDTSKLNKNYTETEAEEISKDIEQK